MSMYNMLFGENPDTKAILSALSLSESDVERFRDCWINEEKKQIVIFTRTGGGNREDYPNKILVDHPMYLYDEDDDFDATYAYYYFSIPETTGGCRTMTDREKLVELIVEIENEIIKAYPYTTDQFRIEETVDHLIANGVTVQEWISVEDRLPEDSAEVILFTRSRIVGSGYYDKYTKQWVQYHAGGAICADVTYWMPLPEDLKEEKS